MEESHINIHYITFKKSECKLKILYSIYSKKSKINFSSFRIVDDIQLFTFFLTFFRRKYSNLVAIFRETSLKVTIEKKKKVRKERNIVKTNSSFQNFNLLLSYCFIILNHSV